MVRRRFPGKPAKCTERNLVPALSVPVTTFDVSSVTNDICKGLAVFENTFGAENETTPFHGFSPHECENAVAKRNRYYEDAKKMLEAEGVVFVCPIFTAEDAQKSVEDEQVSALPNTNSVNYKRVFHKSKKALTKTVKNALLKNRVMDKNSHRLKPKLLGDRRGSYVPCRKFTLPMKSAHSSRVIKPTKRFLDSERSIRKQQAEKSDPVRCRESSSVDVTSYVENVTSSEGRSIRRDGRVLIREARLNIETEPVRRDLFSEVVDAVQNQGELKPKYHSGVITCGICGCVRYYKYILQTRKYGVYSCEPCRRFILRMMSLSKQKTNVMVKCKATSGIGNCVIPPVIRSRFKESHRKMTSSRCSACWLLLSLQRYSMPSLVRTRLTKLLPVSMRERSSHIINHINKEPIYTHSGFMSLESRVDIVKKYAKISGSNCSFQVADRKRLREFDDDPANSSTVRERDKIVVLRRGSSKYRKFIKQHETSKLEEYENAASIQLTDREVIHQGPRIKHVCRSASTVLGTSTVGNQTQDTVSEKEKVRRSETSRIASLESDTSAKDKSGFKRTSSASANNKVNRAVECRQGPNDESSTNEDNPQQTYGARTLQDFGKESVVDTDSEDETNKVISLDFWEDYDPEEIWRTGFPLIATEQFNTRAVCFLCGSAGKEQLIHCVCCCEPYHWYCIESNSDVPTESDISRYRATWVCRKCRVCNKCGVASSKTQVSCHKCTTSYHIDCLSEDELSSRLFQKDRPWVCPKCLKCNSCGTNIVATYIGNLPLCRSCFKLRQKGNYCPLCQGCYEDDDYSVKMMECAICKYWIHAKCEGISYEKYQILSSLPDTVEFVCRLCSPGSPQWLHDVDAELKAGCLRILESLSKNRNIKNLLKQNTKGFLGKRNENNGSSSDCDSIEDSNQNETERTVFSEIQSASFLNDSSESSDELDILSKITVQDIMKYLSKPDDFVSEKSFRIFRKYYVLDVDEHDGSNFWLSKNCDVRHVEIVRLSGITSNIENVTTESEYSLTPANNSNCDIGTSDSSSRTSTGNKKCVEAIGNEPESCEDSFGGQVELKEYASPLKCRKKPMFLSVKKKLEYEEYSLVAQFHEDVIEILNDSDALHSYYKILKDIFPWFDPQNVETIDDGANSKMHIFADSIPRMKDLTSEGFGEDSKDQLELLIDLMNSEQDHEGVDDRRCVFCNLWGDSPSSKEGRLLYCGKNEWVHCNCALWSSEVYEEIDGSLQNVHSAVTRGRQIRCTTCNKRGASVGCCFKNCAHTFHFRCARESSCTFMEDRTVYCKNHSKGIQSSMITSDDDFRILRPVYIEADKRKKRVACHSDVKVAIGSLVVENLGKVDTHLSDDPKYIIPINFRCTRLFWSTRSPWKLIKYRVLIKIRYFYQESTGENNYTLDHSVEIDVRDNEQNMKADEDSNVTKSCPTLPVVDLKEEEFLESQNGTDLLPPELKAAIFEDLRNDPIADMTFRNIWDNYEDIVSNIRADTSGLSYSDSENDVKASKKPKFFKTEGRTDKIKMKKKLKKKQNVFFPLSKTDNSYDIKCPSRAFESDACEIRGNYKSFRKKDTNPELKKLPLIEIVSDTYADKKENHSPGSFDLTTDLLLQLDGAFDDSSSCSSSSYASAFELQHEDEPVKCCQCHRTYRTIESYNRHLQLCSADLDELSEESESTSSEEDKTSENSQPPLSKDISVTFVNSGSCPDAVGTDFATVPMFLNNTETGNNKIPVQNGVYSESAVANDATININCPKGHSSIVIDPKMPINGKGRPIDQSICHVTAEVPSQPPVLINTVPSIAPTYVMVPEINSPFLNADSVNVQCIPSVQQSPIIVPNHVVPASYQLQPNVGIQLMPQTMLGGTQTVLNNALLSQSNILNPPQTYIINNTPQTYFTQQNGLIMSGQPLLGLETLVCNTVLSTSQFIANGNLAYSAVTTQVLQQAAKPVQPEPEPYYLVNGTVSQPITQTGISFQQPLQKLSYGNNAESLNTSTPVIIKYIKASQRNKKRTKDQNVGKKKDILAAAVYELGLTNEQGVSHNSELNLDSCSNHATHPNESNQKECNIRTVENTEPVLKQKVTNEFKELASKKESNSIHDQKLNTKLTDNDCKTTEISNKNESNPKNTDQEQRLTIIVNNTMNIIIDEVPNHNQSTDSCSRNIGIENEKSEQKVVKTEEKGTQVDVDFSSLMKNRSNGSTNTKSSFSVNRGSQSVQKSVKEDEPVVGNTKKPTMPKNNNFLQNIMELPKTYHRSCLEISPKVASSYLRAPVYNGSKNDHTASRKIEISKNKIPNDSSTDESRHNGNCIDFHSKEVNTDCTVQSDEDHNSAKSAVKPGVKISTLKVDLDKCSEKKDVPEAEHGAQRTTGKWKTASISFEVTGEDGFSYKTSSLLDLWNKIYETVQENRSSRKLPLLPKNGITSSESVFGLLGLDNNAMKYLLEQLPDAWKCIFYKPLYHKRPERSEKISLPLNTSGCARTECFTGSSKYDMFGWLASRHRKPPKFLLVSDSDIVNGNRRVTSSNLPMAMRFRHLRETAKEAVGVFRSDIHGRGLFCLRDIDAGEMVIEYAGEVIRSVLTDKREKYYTSKGIGCYMFRIDDKFVVDATMCGNAARFINHSCEPNCYSRIVDILGKKHILIFALRKIPKGEELTYDYKFPLEDEKIYCHCLARKCRKYLN